MGRFSICIQVGEFEAKLHCLDKGRRLILLATNNLSISFSIHITHLSCKHDARFFHSDTYSVAPSCHHSPLICETRCVGSNTSAFSTAFPRTVVPLSRNVGNAETSWFALASHPSVSSFS